MHHRSSYSMESKNSMDKYECLRLFAILHPIGLSYRTSNQLDEWTQILISKERTYSSGDSESTVTCPNFRDVCNALWSRRGSTFRLMEVLAGHTVMAGNGTLSTDVVLSSNDTITGFSCQFVQIFCITTPQKTIDAPTTIIQKTLQITTFS